MGSRLIAKACDQLEPNLKFMSMSGADPREYSALAPYARATVKYRNDMNHFAPPRQYGNRVDVCQLRMSSFCVTYALTEVA